MKNEANIAAWQHLLSTQDDRQAFRQIYFLLAPSLTHFAKAIVKHQQDAEDVVSDVFVRLWEKRHTIDHIGNLRLYLYVATRNFAINRYKQQQRQPAVPVETLSGSDLLLTEHLEDLAEADDLGRHLSQAIEELPPRCRAVFVLVKNHGLRQKEVAELLHLSPKTVENQMAIALKKLGAALALLKSGHP